MSANKYSFPNTSERNATVKFPLSRYDVFLYMCAKVPIDVGNWRTSIWDGQGIGGHGMDEKLLKSKRRVIGNVFAVTIASSCCFGFR